MNCVKPPLTTEQFIVWKEQTFPLSRIRLNLDKANQIDCTNLFAIQLEKTWNMDFWHNCNWKGQKMRNNLSFFYWLGWCAVSQKKGATSQAPHRIIDTLLYLIVIIRKAMKLSASVPKPILLKHNKPKLSATQTIQIGFQLYSSDIALGWNIMVWTRRVTFGQLFQNCP